MKGIVYLSGENVKLACAELKGALKALGNPSEVREGIGQVAILDMPAPGISRRMGFCHFDGEILFETGPDPESVISSCRDCMRETGRTSIGFIIKSDSGNSPLTIFKELEEAARASRVPIDHRTPSFKLFAVIAGGRAFIGRVSGETDRKGLLSRRGSRMPFSRPVIMDPRLARVMVNLSGLPPGSRILDPFMGPGGLAIEASHLGISCVGVEIDERIHEGSLRNIAHSASAGTITAIKGDSRNLREHIPGDIDHFDGIVTDPPFGRSASLGNATAEGLLTEVLMEVRPFLRREAPVVLDMPCNMEQDLEGKYSLMESYEHRVHRSLTRHFLVMRAA
ncbi:MAG: RsmD family RNA methyltransferase [Candidatus Thermoplasmatota archaeon]|nr:RsmD family RNA methyltransferase [Candidatus Thermoplasmatota archaeon]